MARTATERKWTILSLIGRSEQYLSEKGIESPRLNAECMLAHTLNCDRLDLYTRFDKPLVRDEIDQFRSLLIRRGKGEPLQYILGYREWYGRRFTVRPGVLIPRPETEHLVDAARETLNRTQTENPVILDIGTGSGCLAITLALEITGATIVAVDNSDEALGLAAENCNLHNITDRVTLQKINILRDTVPGGEKFDLVVSNPPYIPYDEWKEISGEIRLYEPEQALTDGHDGLTYYRRLAEISPDILKQKGWLLCEIGYNQFERVQNIFKDRRPGELISWNDFSRIPRVIGVTW